MRPARALAAWGSGAADRQRRIRSRRYRHRRRGGRQQLRDGAGRRGAGWHGYAFATADASSTGTLDAGDCGPSCLLTMTGTVGPANAANNFAGYLSVGFKIAMATGSEQVETAAPAGTALRVTFSNGSIAHDLRLVLYDGATSWCATASGPSPIHGPLHIVQHELRGRCRHRVRQAAAPGHPADHPGRRHSDGRQPDVGERQRKLTDSGLSLAG